MKLLLVIGVLVFSSNTLACHVCRYKRSSVLLAQACKPGMRPQVSQNGETTWSESAVSSELDDYLIPTELKQCATKQLETPHNHMKRSLKEAAVSLEPISLLDQSVLSVVLEQINVECVGMSDICSVLRACAVDIYGGIPPLELKSLPETDFSDNLSVDFINEQ